MGTAGIGPMCVCTTIADIAHKPAARVRPSLGTSPTGPFWPLRPFQFCRPLAPDLVPPCGLQTHLRYSHDVSTPVRVVG